TPDQSAVPCAAVCAARKAKAKFVEALDHGVGGTFALEQIKQCSNGALHFLIGVEGNLVIFKHITNRQRESELAFARLVELAAMEARANDVQLCLRKRALHAEHKAVVELGGVVTAILVDHQRAGDGTQLQQAMPVLVGACEA